MVQRQPLDENHCASGSGAGAGGSAACGAAVCGGDATDGPRADLPSSDAANLVVRKLFNPNGVSAWFTSVVAIINQLTLLTIVLTGAAVIREREHGTLEHLLVMPLTAFEIAMAKVWANSLVILIATGTSLLVIVDMVLKVPFAGSVLLWFVGVVLYLFFATALGIFLGTISRSMAPMSWTMTCG